MSTQIAKPLYNKVLEDHIHGVISRLTHRDLQRAVIARGMEFEKVVNSDHHGLVSFFYQHFESSENPQLLNEYDSWIEGILEKKGYKKGEAMLHPSLRFSFTKGIEGSTSHKPITKTSNPDAPKDKPKEIKVKAEKDPDTGVRSGTKKAYTFQLAREGKSTDEIIALVQKRFPEAVDKSIKIWIKRSLSEK